MTKQDEITKLAARLEDGYTRIEEAIAKHDHRNVADWERFWLSLLHDYEQLCDAVEDQAEAVEQAALL